MKSFEIVGLQEVGPRQDDKQGCRALNLPVDLATELAQRASKVSST